MRGQGSPAVTVKEVDLTPRVPKTTGIYGGIVLPGPRGPINQATLVTSETELLSKFTVSNKVEVGYDLAYYSALAFIQKAGALWVVRPRSSLDPQQYGGAVFNEWGASGTGAYGTSPARLRQISKLDDYQDYPWRSIQDFTSGNCNATDDTITLTVLAGGGTNNWLSGEAVRLVAGEAATLPAGVSEDTTYYVIATSTADVVKLAATYANAIADPPVPINFTTSGTGTNTMVPWGNREVLVLAGANQGVWNKNIVAKTTPYPYPQRWSATTRFGPFVEKNRTVTNTTYAIPTFCSPTTPIYDADDKELIYRADYADPETPAADAQTGASEPTWPSVIGGTVTDGDIKWTAVAITSFIPKLSTELTDATKVKEPGAFLLELFHKDDLNTVLESWLCSLKKGTKDGHGRNLFIEDVLLGSELARALVNTAIVDPHHPWPGVSAIAGVWPTIQFSAGDDGGDVSNADMIDALTYLSNADDIPLTVMLDGGRTYAEYALAIDSLCANRGDCVGILSTPYEAEAASDYKNALRDYVTQTLNLSTSYCAMYSPHVKIFDKFNDRYLYVSPDGYAAAVISETAANYELWYPPAGFRRGMINVLDVRRRFDKGTMDFLYDNNINPNRFAPGRGILIWGQKTMLRRPSALDRLNVRLLLTVIEPNVKLALEDFVFEFNDASTRSLVTTVISSYMDMIKAKRGCYDYQVVCDDTNNTPEEIDSHIMNLWLFVKPTIDIEYIPFTLVLTRTGTSFELAAQQL